jgi:hypothetical protein
MWGFWWAILRERDPLEDLGVNGRILNGIFKKKNLGINWIDLALHKDT